MSSSAAHKVADGKTVPVSLQYNPEERKQTNLVLVDHLINDKPVRGSTKMKAAMFDEKEKTKRRLKFPKRNTSKEAEVSASDKTKEFDARTLEILQKVNVSLTQEVTMLREQRDQAVQAASAAKNKVGMMSKAKKWSEGQRENESSNITNENDQVSASVDFSDTNIPTKSVRFKNFGDTARPDILGAESKVALLQKEIDGEF